MVRQDRKSSPLLIEHENLDDKIYARLKGMIADGQLAPGQRILQEKLARDMGVSRTPLVNALKRLAQERLVEWVSRRGIYVKQFSLKEMAQLFEVREGLEPIAARLAATRISPAEVRSVQEGVRRIQQETVRGRGAAVSQVRSALSLAPGGINGEPPPGGGDGVRQHDDLRVPNRGPAQPCRIPPRAPGDPRSSGTLRPGRERGGHADPHPPVGRATVEPSTHRGTGSLSRLTAFPCACYS